MIEHAAVAAAMANDVSTRACGYPASGPGMLKPAVTAWQNARLKEDAASSASAQAVRPSSAPAHRFPLQAAASSRQSKATWTRVPRPHSACSIQQATSRLQLSAQSGSSMVTAKCAAFQRADGTQQRQDEDDLSTVQRVPMLSELRAHSTACTAIKHARLMDAVANMPILERGTKGDNNAM